MVYEMSKYYLFMPLYMDFKYDNIFYLKIILCHIEEYYLCLFVTALKVI